MSLLVLPLASRATILVPMPDASLVERADVVVTALVERTKPVRTARGGLETWATLRVIDRLKGAPPDRIVFRQPGGHDDAGFVHVFGTTPLAADEAVLVFGRADPSGGYRPVAMALGIYHLTLDDVGIPTATRGGPGPSQRALGEFVGAIGTAAQSATTTIIEPPRRVTAPFTFLGSPPSRWFEFDRGRTVTIRPANRIKGLTRAKSDEIIRAAFAAWTDVPSATARLRIGNDTAAAPSVAGGICDGHSTAQFNDPFDEIEDLSSCAGTIAIAGFCAAGLRLGPNGVTFREITEGDITMNGKIDSCYGETNILEIVTHETGHVLGLGHSSEDPFELDARLRDATMFWLGRFDGRGASLRADDIAGLVALYPGDDDGDKIPDEYDLCPDTPPGMAADETGCACVDPGHVVCPPSTTCTESGCDESTGLCVETPVDCTGGDPCVAGACTLEAGCEASHVGGFDAIRCALVRDFAPSECTDERIPRRVRRAIKRAFKVVDRAGRATDDKRERLLDRGRRRVEKALERLDSATDPARKHPVGAECAAATKRLLDDARIRIESRGAEFLYDPRPQP